MFRQKKCVFHAPKLRRLVLVCIESPCSDSNILMEGLGNLTHLDLSNCWNISNFQFLSKVSNLVSLILYNVGISEIASQFVVELAALTNLR